MIEALLKAGADPNAAFGEGETPLMTAARTGSVDAVKVLLELGAKVNAREAWRGQTALMWAAAENHAAVVQAADRAPRRRQRPFDSLRFPEADRRQRRHHPRSAGGRPDGDLLRRAAGRDRIGRDLVDAGADLRRRSSRIRLHADADGDFQRPLRSRRAPGRKRAPTSTTDRCTPRSRCAIWRPTATGRTRPTPTSS